MGGEPGKHDAGEAPGKEGYQHLHLALPEVRPLGLIWVIKTLTSLKANCR